MTERRQARRAVRRSDRRSDRLDDRQERRDARQQGRQDRREARDQRRAARATQAAPPRPRRRRAPELARKELLDAAERLFAAHPPDQVGLKDVAREAGVSHALITHYFGTYAGLVEATLQRRLTTLREAMLARLGEAGALSRPQELLAILFDAFEDPVHLRLMKWIVSSERPGVIHALAFEHQGLQRVAAQVAGALASEPRREMIEAIELALMAAVAAALGYAVGKYALAGAAGRAPSAGLDVEFRETLAAMVRTYLAARLGIRVPT